MSGEKRASARTEASAETNSAVDNTIGPRRTKYHRAAAKRDKIPRTSQNGAAVSRTSPSCAAAYTQSHAPKGAASIRTSEAKRSAARTFLAGGRWTRTLIVFKIVFPVSMNHALLRSIRRKPTDLLAQSPLLYD